MADQASMIASFIEAAPPGELNDVVKDIKALLPSGDLISTATVQAAFRDYNETQFTAATLPGASSAVLVTPYNTSSSSRYHDPASSTSFAYNHTTRTASSPQSEPLDSPHADLIKSISKALSTHASEHFPSFTLAVYPPTVDDDLHICLVSSKYSPSNFWNGRWRSHYAFNPSTGKLTGGIKVDVHYYEDGNVRMLTSKDVSSTIGGSASASDIARQIATAEKKYQEDLNRAFGTLSEGTFKSLRRQLPVTRQKIEWEKISGYRLGQDIGGGRSR